MRNTDRIKVLASRQAAFRLRLDRGPLAPGATRETTGRSEIELEVSGRQVLGLVSGTRRADEFRWGSVGDSKGLDLNPGRAGRGDIDITVAGPSSALVAVGGGGPDKIVPQPDVTLDYAIASQGGEGNDFLDAPTLGGIQAGGPGNDRISGGRSGDAMVGGFGRDHLIGGRGPDLLNGGPGRDRASGGAGRDSVDSSDRRRETVRCGPGRDRVRADRSDRLRGCEAVRRASGR